MGIVTRPVPPIELTHDFMRVHFAPAPDLKEWCYETFINDDAELVNEAHAHLRQADVAFLWTNEPNVRQMRRVLATAEMAGSGMGGKWQRARLNWQMLDWFGDVPDFLITMYAPAVVDMTNVEFMALCEHEILHCGQAVDEFGGPKFSRETGKPIYTLRGHDFSEFVSVVERYGATSPELAQAIEAANAGPTINPVRVDHLCGNCLRLAS